MVVHRPVLPKRSKNTWRKKVEKLKRAGMPVLAWFLVWGNGHIGLNFSSCVYMRLCFGYSRIQVYGPPLGCGWPNPVAVKRVNHLSDE